METVKEKSSENLHFSWIFVKIERVNCSMTDVATIHFKQNKGMRQRWWVGTDCIQSKLLNQTTQWSSGQRRRGETRSKLKTCKQQFESVLCSKSVAFRFRGFESLHSHINLRSIRLSVRTWDLNKFEFISEGEKLCCCETCHKQYIKEHYKEIYANNLKMRHICKMSSDNTVIRKRVSNEELEKYITMGWKQGRKI